MKHISLNEHWLYRKTSEHDFRQISLPFDAAFFEKRSPLSESGSKKGYFPNGAYEFYTLFDRPEEDSCYYLEFESVYQNAFVYLNGNELAFHPYGYTDFILDITDSLEEKSNYLKVLCSSRDDSRWYSGTGILRPVTLHIGNKQGHFLPYGVRVTTVEANEDFARLSFSLQVKTAAEVTYLLRIYNSQGNCVLEYSTKQTQFEVCLNHPELWDDEKPLLEHFTIQMICGNQCLDECQDDFGIRTIKVDTSYGLRINGKKKILLGTCVHADNGVIGCYSDAETERRKIQALKQAGFNAIRSAHHPANKDLLKACDELGVYVFEETFDSWHYPKCSADYSLYFDRYYQEDIHSMVNVSYNHPSVILYSVGNEVADLFSDQGSQTEKELVQCLKKEDPTRLVSNAINGVMLFLQAIEVYGRKSGQDLMMGNGDVNDTMNTMREKMKAFHLGESMDKMLALPCSYLDVSGYNYMPERYPHDEKKNPNRVIVGTESYAMDMVEIYDYLFSHQNVIGDFCWIGLDYLGEAGIGKITYDGKDNTKGVYSEYPYLTAGCGDLDITLDRQPVSYYREIAMHKRNLPYIVVHNPLHEGETPSKTLWSFEDVLSCWNYPTQEGKKVTVDVYSSSKEVSLYLNGILIDTKKTEKDKARFCVEYQPGVLSAVDKEGNQFSLSSYGKERHLQVKEEGENLCFLNMDYVDEDGKRILNEEVKISLEIENGKLLGFGNGCSQTEEEMNSLIHTTYHGHALAVVKREPGFAYHLTIIK